MEEVNLLNPTFRKSSMNRLSLQIFLSATLAITSLQANAQLGNLVKDIKGLADSAEKKLSPTPAPSQPAPAAAPTQSQSTASSKSDGGISYPAEIQGKWAFTAKDCSFPSLEIDSKNAVMGTEQSCQIKSVKDNDGKFAIRELCSGEGGSATENATYSVSGNNLTRSYRKFSDKYVRCGAAVAPAPAKASNESSAMTCKVVPGSAGVTTFLDEKLKKSGNAIRDFDNYTFKADKKIKVNNTEVLVGKLIRSDGSISEAKSYAFADEWNCK